TGHFWERIERTLRTRLQRGNSPIPATARLGVLTRAMVAEKAQRPRGFMLACFSSDLLLRLQACLLTTRPRGMGSPQAHKTGRRLQQLTGALCSRRKGHHPQQRRHLINFVALTGDQFTASLGDTASGRKRRKISRRVFLLCCSNAEI